METKDTKNEEVNKETLANENAERLMSEAKNRDKRLSKKSNKLWLWLGVLVLIFILLWWLFAIGTFDDLLGVANG